MRDPSDGQSTTAADTTTRSGRRERRALVVNTYSLGNWGDTAIAEGLIDALRVAGYEHVAMAPVDWSDRRPGATLAEPDEILPPLVNLLDVPPTIRPLKVATLGWVGMRIARAYGGRRDPLMRPYRSADLVVSVGGGFLGGTKSGANLVKVANVRAGVIARRPTIVGPVSANPFTGNVGRVLRWGLRGSQVFARDRASLDRLRSCGLDARFAPDTAFRAPSLLAAARWSAQREGTSATGLIGWSPRRYRTDHRAWGDPEAAESRTLAAVQRVLATPEERLAFIPHVRVGTSDDDMSAVTRLMGRLTPAQRDQVEILPDPATLEDSVRQFAGVDVLVTSRMHAAIFAMAVGTPAIAVAYEPKVRQILEDAGLGDRVVEPSADLNDRELADLITRLRRPEERARTRRAFDAVQDRFGDLITALAGAAAL
jgi:colanic acid/amylovoran biosynthesis protein WcaK/AmsJ